MTAIIIFALAAIFLGLRLYAVLGSRTGHEQSLPRQEEAKPITGTDSSPPRDAAQAARLAPQVDNQDANAGLRAIGAADRSFSLPEFVDGAQSAYRMILEGFWAGKIDEIADFVSADVREAFAEAAKTREEAGEVLDSRLVAIERTTVAGASLVDGVARITLRFDADIAAVTRDKDGVVIAGSLTDAIATHDVWTFERAIRSTDPNWTLVDTDEA